nr:pancreatic lipase-related protein 2-like isoform X2 [Procambarus clarkii]XP_045619457.1 pancreatic lipase-related protein 2-like isoform X2 [Procambarus clarkii]
MESGGLDWVQRMVKSLLESEGVGVVTVDWWRGAQPPYAQAVANSRLVGAITGYLIHLLAEYYSVAPGSVHLVGHSLGAHLMGYAGDYVKITRGERVGRITGLDPAGPYFTNTPPEVRLDPTDADFVDVIHTDVPVEAWQLAKMGHPDAIGHIDFYPNGGSDQAGCKGSAVSYIENERTVAGGILTYIGCNHHRSFDYFTESILSQCRFVGVVCGSWEEYQTGACWGCHHAHCPTMGITAHPIHPQTHPTPNVLAEHGSPSTVHTPNVNNSGDVGSGAGRQTGRSEAGGGGAGGGGGGGAGGGGERQPSVAPSVKVFLGTNPRPPYCAEQYRVSVVTALTPAAVRSGGDLARFTVTLRGQDGHVTIPAPGRPTFVEAGGGVSWVGFTPPLGVLLALQVEYESHHGLLHALIFRFTPPTLYVSYFHLQQLSTGLVLHFPFCGGQMKAGESYTLFPDTQCGSLH